MKLRVCRFLIVWTVVLLAGCDRSDAGSDSADVVSDVKADETVVFFQTSAWLDATDDKWHLPIHGWIYEPEDSSVRSSTLETILEEKYDLIVSNQARSNFSRRVNLLLSDNERGKRIVIDIAGKHYDLPESAENGHFETTIVIPAASVATHARDGFIRFAAVTREDETRTFGGSIRLIDSEGLSVISDIDDTVKISNVTDRKSLLEYTFLLDFAAAPGMAELYRDWSSEDVGFHFVSSSPWHLYEPLNEFLTDAGFPWATFSLKSVRFRDTTLFDLFKKGTETKPVAIKKILDRYPAREFILVGDSGEQDPEVYAALLRERPEQITNIYIRNVTQASRSDERFASLFDGIEPERWHLFESPDILTELGSE